MKVDEQDILLNVFVIVFNTNYIPLSIGVHLLICIFMLGMMKIMPREVVLLNLLVVHVITHWIVNLLLTTHNVKIISVSVRQGMSVCIECTCIFVYTTL